MLSLYQSYVRCDDENTRSYKEISNHRLRILISKCNGKPISLEVIADEENLRPIKKKQTQKCRAFIAAYISGVRLIDNIKLY